MNYSLRVITPPAAEPVTLAEVKEHMHHDFTLEDDLLNRWIKEGREKTEIYMRRAFITQTLEMSFDRLPGSWFYLLRAPLISVTSIKLTDSADVQTTVDNTIYSVDTSREPGRVALKFGKTWPAITLQTIDAVKVRYVSGFGAASSDVPQFIKDAITLYVSIKNETRGGEEEDPMISVRDVLREKRVATVEPQG